MKHKHKWVFIAESRWSYNEWCSECGAWKRTSFDDDSTETHLPKTGFGNLNSAKGGMKL